MAQPIIHHRTPQFEALFAEAAEGAAAALPDHAGRDHARRRRARGAMEAAVINTTVARRRACCVVNGGKFGERWGRSAETYGLNVDGAQGRVGHAPSIPRRSTQALKRRTRDAAPSHAGAARPRRRVLPPGRGDRQDHARARHAARRRRHHRASACSTCRWTRSGIDVLLTGSQKALMLPPGLAFVALSREARGSATRVGRSCRASTSTSSASATTSAKHTTAWTPAISLIFGPARGARA